MGRRPWHRDADVEGQTDGFSETWAHGSLGGITDKTMGWGAGGLYAQVFTINVGCMYVRPTARAALLMAGASVHSRHVHDAC